eukprot:3675222-Alexandrium_andersonii.AAC.1
MGDGEGLSGPPDHQPSDHAAAHVRTTKRYIGSNTDDADGFNTGKRSRPESSIMVGQQHVVPHQVAHHVVVGPPFLGGAGATAPTGSSGSSCGQPAAGVHCAEHASTSSHQVRSNTDGLTDDDQQHGLGASQVATHLSVHDAPPSPWRPPGQCAGEGACAP